ncbi:MAG: GFA family protein [Novosphingobium sp.]
MVDKRPDYVHACNCTLCSKTGAHWSYFHPSEVKVEGATRQYSRTDKDDPSASIHFCPKCGSTTHFTLTESAVAQYGDVQLGVNMLLAEPTDLAGVELRYPDGRAWSGGADFGYVRGLSIIGEKADGQ